VRDGPAVAAGGAGARRRSLRSPIWRPPGDCWKRPSLSAASSPKLPSERTASRFGGGLFAFVGPFCRGCRMSTAMQHTPERLQPSRCLRVSSVGQRSIHGGSCATHGCLGDIDPSSSSPPDGGGVADKIQGRQGRLTVPNATPDERRHAEYHVLTMLAHGHRLAAETLTRYQSPQAPRLLRLAEHLEAAANDRERPDQARQRFPLRAI
jgi:hypothetical protein